MTVLSVPAARRLEPLGPSFAEAMRAAAGAAAALFAEILRFPDARADGADADAVTERFRRLALPHLDSAYNFARFLSRDADAAQDITQEAFLRAFRSFGDFRGESARAWLFAIVRNCHLDWRARRARPGAGDGEAVDAETIPDESDDPEAALVRSASAGAVRRTLMALPDAFREILVLREIEDLPYREIADTLHVPIGTVMSRLARARKLFSEIWLREDATGRASR